MLGSEGSEGCDGDGLNGCATGTDGWVAEGKGCVTDGAAKGCVSGPDAKEAAPKAGVVGGMPGPGWT